MRIEDDRFWFEPNKFGYGAGKPIAWQGWALLLVYTLVMLAPTPALEWDPVMGLGIAIAVWVPATLLLVVIAKRKTRGEWRWRWGSTD